MQKSYHYQGGRAGGVVGNCDSRTLWTTKCWSSTKPPGSSHPLLAGFISLSPLFFFDILLFQTFHEEHKSSVLSKLEVERWRKGQATKSELESLHPVLGEQLGVADIPDGKEIVEELLVGEESHTFAEAVIPLLSALSSYLTLGDSLPNARVEASHLYKLNLLTYNLLFALNHVFRLG